MFAADLALAFNASNTRKAWQARSNTRDSAELVHFINNANLVNLVYDCRTGLFAVRFNKVHAAWGDYIKAIARALHIVLNTLKEAGLTLHAPDDYENIEIIATATNDNIVYVRWAGQSAIDDGGEDQLPFHTGPQMTMENILPDTVDTDTGNAMLAIVDPDTTTDGDF